MISDIKLDEDEKLIIKISRSKIGLLPLWLLALAVFLSVLGGVFTVAKYQDNLSPDISLGLAVLMILGVGAVVETIVLLAIQVYTSSRLFLTDERLILLARKGIFQQNVSQLSLIDVQDITVSQPHFTSNLFDYGTLTIETAGEKDNLIFKFLPDGHNFAQKLDDACEQYKLRDQARMAAQLSRHLPPQPTG